MASDRAHRILRRIYKDLETKGPGSMDIDAISEIVEGFESEADSLLKRDHVLNEEGEEMPGPGETQGTLEDPALDPALEKEYYLKSIEQGKHTITLKTIGIGKNKPVSVYIDGFRWEMFPGPIKAEAETIAFVQSKHFDKWLSKFDAPAPSEPAPEEEPADEAPPETDTKDSETEGPNASKGKKADNDGDSGSSDDEEK